MTTRVIDHGWNRIVKEMKAMKGSYVKVGYPNDSKKEKNGASVLDVAMVHEFGLPSKNIPSRPFMSKAFDENEAERNKKTEQLKSDIFAGKTTTRKALSVLGSWFKGIIQEKIVEGKFKPLSKKTIARKGSSAPLIDTGRMRQSVQYEVHSK